MEPINPYETTPVVSATPALHLAPGMVEIDTRELSAALGTVAQVVYGGLLRSRSSAGTIRYRVDSLHDKVPGWAKSRKWGETVVNPSKRTVQRAVAKLKKLGLLVTVGRSPCGSSIRRVYGDKTTGRNRRIIVPAVVAENLGVDPLSISYQDAEAAPARAPGSTKNIETRPEPQLPNIPCQETTVDDLELDRRDLPPQDHERGIVSAPPQLERVPLGDVNDWVGRMTEPRAKLTDNAPAVFTPSRFVPADCAYYDDIPSLRIPRGSVNRSPEREVITEYEHRVYGTYSRVARTDLEWPEIPDVDSSVYSYHIPTYPELTLGKPRDIARQMVAAYRAVMEYRTGEPCTAYEDGLTRGELKCVLVAARKLAKHKVKPHAWAMHWTRVMMRGKDAWLPHVEDAPKITQVFTPGAIDKQWSTAAKHRYVEDAYMDVHGSKAMKLLAGLKKVVKELTHYSRVTQDDLDRLVVKRLVAYDGLMQRMRAIYVQRTFRDERRIAAGKWVWANVENKGDNR